MNSKLRKLKNNYFEPSMLRWALVGITTTLIDYTIFIFSYRPINSVFAANLIAASLATTFNYVMHHRWTFKSGQHHAISGVKYFLNLIFWWLVSSSIIKTLVVIGVEVKVAKLAPLIFIVPINYFVLNRIVFKKKS
jgi:putative flippase GtrA